MFNTFRVGNFLIAALVAACVSAVSRAEVGVQRVNYRGWSGAVRLSNGTVEAVVVPAIGRIMRYGYIGGRNLVWEDPQLSGQPADRRAFPRFGGNKAWPWPQDEWPQHIGHDWPPPPAADQAEFTVSIAGGGVRMESPLIVGFGLRIVREISLAPTGTRLTLTTRLVRDGASLSPRPIAAWSITPATAPDALYVHLTANSALPSHSKPLGAFDPFASLTEETGCLHVVRDPSKSSKIGIDGDAIGAAYGDVLWTLRDRTDVSSAGTGTTTPGERVQIYANADSREDTARGLPPYMEFELTSPRRILEQPGDSVTLTETWELARLTPDTDARKAFLNMLARPAR